MKININEAIENGYLLDKYGKYAAAECKYKDQPIVSPPFRIENLENDVNYISWYLIDHDSNPLINFSWIHWLAANLDVSDVEDTVVVNEKMDTKTMINGTNSFNSPIANIDDIMITQRYVGPTPPDRDHEYTFVVIGTKEKLVLEEGFNFGTFYKAAKKAVILDREETSFMSRS